MDLVARAVSARLPHWMVASAPPFIRVPCIRLRHRMGAAQYGCIFVQIPKCAGTSIISALFSSGVGHVSMRDYRLAYSPHELSRFHSFTFVRNPWDRLASAYFFLKAGGVTRQDARFARRHLASDGSTGAIWPRWRSGISGSNARPHPLAFSADGVAGARTAHRRERGGAGSGAAPGPPAAAASRGGTLRLSRVRASLLRIRPRAVHRLPHGVCGGLLLQGRGFCPSCNGNHMAQTAAHLADFITEPGPFRKILTHVGEPLEPPPVSPARGPPTDWGELVQDSDERDALLASPDDLPVIDIHSL